MAYNRPQHYFLQSKIAQEKNVPWRGRLTTPGPRLGKVRAGGNVPTQDSDEIVALHGSTGALHDMLDHFAQVSKAVITGSIAQVENCGRVTGGGEFKHDHACTTVVIYHINTCIVMYHTYRPTYTMAPTAGQVPPWFFSRVCLP